MHCQILADNPNATSTIASWYYHQWGHLSADRTLETVQSSLSDYLNRDTLPLILMLCRDDEPVAVAQLRFQENPDYPKDSHWLGGVFVKQSERGKRLGNKIIQLAIEKARTMNITTLYLQTESHNIKLYRQQGWQQIDTQDNHGITISIMVNQL
ncbi:GNAT family N-acetyltransferase [Shewanella psychrotolerans]|uniref:GNAT family N-acetyltransferase n=1 Tax=Shewanella psychrotolerans TaxID=2864206 RepID=UPI001C65E21B|nr:GNAT family N-acetyltransferase [Shewanella psychrotolerans]QYK01441.1 GNAT family N-acetyltransferase [Shewanella psychrotolerans]